MISLEINVIGFKVIQRTREERQRSGIMKWNTNKLKCIDFLNKKNIMA